MRSGQPLPTDINALVEGLAAKHFNSAELNERLTFWREKKLFGNITHYVRFKVNGADIPLDAFRCEFHYGVIKSCWYKSIVGTSTIEERSVRNDRVYFCNPEKTQKGVKNG